MAGPQAGTDTDVEGGVKGGIAMARSAAGKPLCARLKTKGGTEVPPV